MTDTEHRWDKFALFLLAGLVVIVLGLMVTLTFVTRTVPDKGDVLLGGIATGLILFLRDLVNAVRTSWEEVTRGKIADQLAGSSPPDTGPSGAPGDPLHTQVDNPPSEPVPTTEGKP